MVVLKSLLAVLAVAATLVPDVAAGSKPSKGLHRRRCKAVPSGPGGAINVGANPNPTSSPNDAPSNDDPAPAPAPAPPKPSKPSGGKGCFPSKGFNMPDSPNGIDLDDWWCDEKDEYAFMGFSYGVDGCPSKSGLTNSFKQMVDQFDARYVRLYGTCDRANFNSDVVDAAWDAGIGVYGLVWFGFTGGNEYKKRLDGLLDAATENPKGKYVIRSCTVGSEALYDSAISPGNLINTLGSVRNKVGKNGCRVSTSEMAYQLTNHRDVLNAVDNVQLNVLPFFAGDASSGGKAKNRVLGDLNNIRDATNSKKKIFMTQTGWPSNQKIWKANAASAVSSIASEAAYYDLLDDMCSTFKDYPQGGVGWFAHIFEDNNLSGWGIVQNGQKKFNFNPRTHC